MFFIYYKNSDKKIVFAKYDGYTGAEGAASPQQQLVVHCEINDLNVNDFTAVELPFDKKFMLIQGNHVFNESTKQIETDPNWVAPTPDPEPTQGTPA
jgi:hypothetical protein